MRRFLYISPYFPPTGGISVKRALILVRNFHLVGWEPWVLASPPPAHEPHDEVLTALLPSDIPVSYTYNSPWSARLKRVSGVINHASSMLQNRLKRASSPTEIGGPTPTGTRYLFPLDRFMVDIAAAVASGERLIREHGLELIHVNAGPFSGLVTGHLLSKRTGLPWIADMRDPWTLHEGKTALRPWLTQQVDKAIEHWTLRSASRIALNTEDCLAAYRSAYQGRIPAERFTVVRNAFDPTIVEQALEGVPEPDEDRPFTFLFFGRFKVMVEPDTVLKGLGRFVERAGLGPEQVRFAVLGGLRERDRLQVDALGLTDYVEDRGYVSLLEGYQHLRAAHVLVLAIVPKLCIPGKIYDYLAVGRPILALSENPEVDRIVEETGAGVHVAHGNIDAIADRMLQLFEGRHPEPQPKVVQTFNAQTQVERLAALFEASLAEA